MESGLNDTFMLTYSRLGKTIFRTNGRYHPINGRGNNICMEKMLFFTSI